MGIQVFKSGGATVSAYLKLAGGVTLSSSLVSVVDQADNTSPLQLATASAQFVAPLFLSVPAWTLGGARSNFILTSTVASAAAGANTYKMINNVYTINNTAAQTGTITGIFQNVTETALNGITHNLLDLQVGGVSAFKVGRNGFCTLNGIISAQEVGLIAGGIILFSGRARIKSPSTNAIMFQDNAETSASNLILGLQTNLFPMIKRNGAQIDFRLADDSDFCAINAKSANFGGLDIVSGSVIQQATQDIRLVTPTASKTVVVSQDYSFQSSTSALFEVKSTTKGFLMPRMTTAQINAIATPANGLMVYNTTQLEPCFYDGTGWKRLLHLAM